MKEKLLTKEIAEQFVAGKIDSLDEFTSIEDNAAQALSPFKGDPLSLNGLTSLSVGVAKSLASFKRRGDLYLAGLITLTDEVAMALAPFKGYWLDLDGLTTITDESAKALASVKVTHLYLNGLRSITVVSAKALASVKAESLFLNGLTNLSDDVAMSLASFKGLDLNLNGQTNLTEGTAKALASFTGSLYLDGLTSLSVMSAKALASCNAYSLMLNGLKHLSDETAKALASFMGKGGLQLNGLTSLSNEAARALASCEHSVLVPDGLKSDKYAVKTVEDASALDSVNNDESEESLDCDIDGSDQEDIASEGSQTPLIAALAEGYIAEADRLRAGGARIYEDAETLNGFFSSLWDEHSLCMFSRPVNPDILPRIVSLKDVIKSCGPIYESGGACFSLSQRPSGWASAVKAQRVLSWHDSGFGFVGDQAVDINLRLVSAKPLTAFAVAIIAGPLPEDGFPEMPDGFIQDKQTSRERRKLPTREEAHRLFYNLVVCQMDLDWTKDLAQYQCLRQPALQLLAEERQKLSGGNDARMEFSLFGDIGDRKKSLKNLAAADPSVAGLTALLLLAAECVSALEERKKTSAILKRHAKTKPVTKWEVALWDISLLCLQAADGKAVEVADVEAFLPFFRNPDEPALSIQIERTCSALCSHIAAQYLENHDSMDSALAYRMCKCGWRPPAGSILMPAIEAENTDFLKYLLSYGMYPKGHPGRGINLVPLATAAMRGNKDAVKLLLDAGADPLEPSHYGGASTLHQARWNCANLEVGEKEKACLKLLEKAVRNDPRVAWLAPAQDDSE